MLSAAPTNRFVGVAGTVAAPTNRFVGAAIVLAAPTVHFLPKKIQMIWH